MERINYIICFVRLKAIHNVILKLIEIEKRKKNPRNFMKLLVNVFINTLKPESGIHLLQDDKDGTKKKVELYNSSMPGSVESPSYNAYFFMSLMNKSGCFDVTTMPFLRKYQGDMCDGYYTVNSDGTITSLVDTINLIHDDFYELCDLNSLPTQIDDGVLEYHSLSRINHELDRPRAWSFEAGYTPPMYPDPGTFDTFNIDSKELSAENDTEKGISRVVAFLDDVEDEVRKAAIEFAIKKEMTGFKLLDRDSSLQNQLRKLNREVASMKPVERNSWEELLKDFSYSSDEKDALKKRNGGNKKSRRRKIQTRRRKTRVNRRRKTSRK